MQSICFLFSIAFSRLWWRLILIHVLLPFAFTKFWFTIALLFMISNVDPHVGLCWYFVLGYIWSLLKFKAEKKIIINNNHKNNKSIKLIKYAITPLNDNFLCVWHDRYKVKYAQNRYSSFNSSHTVIKTTRSTAIGEAAWIRNIVCKL